MIKRRMNVETILFFLEWLEMKFRKGNSRKQIWRVIGRQPGSWSVRQMNWEKSRLVDSATEYKSMGIAGEVSWYRFENKNNSKYREEGRETNSWSLSNKYLSKLVLLLNITVIFSSLSSCLSKLSFANSECPFCFEKSNPSTFLSLSLSIFSLFLCSNFPVLSLFL